MKCIISSNQHFPKNYNLAFLSENQDNSVWKFAVKNDLYYVMLRMNHLRF